MLVDGRRLPASVAGEQLQFGVGQPRVAGQPSICNATPQFGLPRGFSVGTVAALER